MRAFAKRRGDFEHEIRIRDHQLTADEPTEAGGQDLGPSPEELLAASLASCTAITIQMYAKRKGWDVGDIGVVCDYQPAERGRPTQFDLILKIPHDMPEEQADKLTAIAAKCPIHRTLEGEVVFNERVKRIAPV